MTMKRAPSRLTQKNVPLFQLHEEAQMTLREELCRTLRLCTGCPIGDSQAAIDAVLPHLWTQATGVPLEGAWQ